MLLALSAVLLAAAVYLTGEVVTQPGRERHRAVRRAATYGRARVGGNSLERLRFHERVIAPAARSLARVVLRVSPRLTVDSISARLLAAGMGRSLTPVTFLALKGAGALAGILFGLVLGGSVGGPALGLVAALVVGGFGFILPGVVVSMRGRKRREEIKAQLPDALDLLAVSVEAGLGFDGAVAKMTEHMDGALAEEFSLTLGEMRIGESRQDALKKLAERAGAPEVASFSRAIIQADQLGISLGRILRVQAADSRLKRQAAAEERAMKSPIKMLFPTVIFIFPAMFLVILGPALLNLMEVF
ncbi:MAG: type II secretion system F family protein [Actinomycetota bacterium]|nr:type II secretion system F family protein [Actinomycetota bacterium]